jgi:hypothetical protein
MRGVGEFLVRCRLTTQNCHSFLVRFFPTRPAEFYRSLWEFMELC